MIINTNAIVLKTFSYGETSLISRCFTKDRGKISFINPKRIEEENEKS